MYIQDSISLAEIPKSGKVKAVLSKKNFLDCQIGVPWSKML